MAIIFLANEKSCYKERHDVTDMWITNKRGSDFQDQPSSNYMIREEMNGYRSEQEEHSTTSAQICCLVEDGERCKRQSGNASYSKRIQKTVGQRKLKLSLDSNARHIYICDYHKNMIQSVRSKRKRKESDDEHDSPDVDFCSLQVNTLRRYKRHFKLQTRPGLNKAQLVETIQRHFKQLHCPEKETITYFIYMIKTSKSKWDQKNDNS